MALGLFALSGCVTEMPRPTDWPADKPLLNPTEMDGTYVGQPGVLTMLLDPLEDSREHEVRVAVAPGDRLTLEFMFDSGSKRTVTLPFTIEDGWMLVSHRVMLNGGGVAAYESQTLRMRLDVSGAMLVKLATLDAGMMFFVPTIGKYQQWYRIQKKPNHPTEPLSPSRGGSS